MFSCEFRKKNLRRPFLQNVFGDCFQVSIQFVFNRSFNLFWPASVLAQGNAFSFTDFLVHLLIFAIVIKLFNLDTANILKGFFEY